MPTTRVPTDSLTSATPSVKNQSLVFHPMTYTIGQPSNFNLSNPICLFGLRISRVSPQASQRLLTLSQTFIVGYICLTKNKIWVFHLRVGGGGGGVLPQASQCLLTLSQTFLVGYICLTKNKIWVFHLRVGGICPILLHPNTRDLLLLSFYTIVSLDFGRCPISELTTHSPRMVNKGTMHPHLTRCDVTVHMKCNHAISCDIMLHAQ